MTAASLPLLLVKHAAPIVEPDRPPATWALSVAGRRRAVALAATLKDRRPARIVSSAERKAVETAEILAATLGVPREVRADLREHERPGLPFLAEPGAFEARMREAFERPAERLFGGESVGEAVERFARAVESLRDAHPAERLCLVSHGTVIAGYAARVAGVAALPLWRSLDLPSWIEVDVEHARVVDGWRASWSDDGAGPRAP